MPKLPGSGNVQKVSAQAGRDPGVRLSGTPAVPSVSVPTTRAMEVRAPEGAFASPLGTAAGELAPGLEKMALAARAQENRRDTVDRADKINIFRNESNAELLRLSTEDDLSRDEVLQGYGQFVQKRRMELLNEHKGSEDSRASLAIRLQELESDAIGTAAATSTRLGRDKVVNLYKDRLNPLISTVQKDPSFKNINNSFMALETELEDLKGAFDPTEEENMRRGGREQIGMSAVNSLILRGRIEEADSLIQGGLSDVLSPETKGEMAGRIERVRFAKEEFSRKKMEAETFLGRPLTQQESLGMLGLSQPAEDIVAVVDKENPEKLVYVPKSQAVGREAPNEAKLSESDKQKLGLVNRGVDPDMASDIVDGNIRVVGPDNTGQFYTINLVTNEKSVVPESQAGPIVDMVTDAAQEVASKQKPRSGPMQAQGNQTSIEDATAKGTGPFSNVQAGLSNIIGPFVDGALFEDTTKARQQLSTFMQTAKTALVNNDRFPVAEQQLVANLLPNPDQFFKDPDTARSNLKELRASLTSFKDAKTQELGKKGLTTTRRGELNDQISRIDELLTLMQPATGGEIASPQTQEEFDALPSGAKFVNPADGKTYTKK